MSWTVLDTKSKKKINETKEETKVEEEQKVEETKQSALQEEKN
jgi:hypothetical protein